VLFNSYIFVFCFLPLTLVGFLLIGSRGHRRIAVLWLVSASLFYYGWWNPAYLKLIVGSVLFNYAMGTALGKLSEGAPRTRRRLMLAFGIGVNLALIGYFKYFNFFVDNVNRFADTAYHVDTIVLPLAISFFTFQQITFLVDSYTGETREHRFLDYCLFVTFFPQLIAGPIVHHREMMPQFAGTVPFRFDPSRLAVGLSIFGCGLFKKIILADGVALYSTPVFDAAARGNVIAFADAWTAALAYTFQLYFDFSGYSDMAIGLAWLFGICLPLNFDSPYKSRNIIEFWRRWHMTLSRFLRDYLYFPLGGNRKGTARRYANLLITMLLGGLWHGAGWTFVLWGGLHGVYLMVNHGVHALRRMLGHNLHRSTSLGRGVSWALTFLAVVVGWVLFRSEDMHAATAMYTAMLGLGPGAIGFVRLDAPGALAWVSGLMLLARFAPNTHQWMNIYAPAIDTYGVPPCVPGTFSSWRPSAAWAAVLAVLFFTSFAFMSSPSEFLYFDF
jgi:alginate O-acetyltransferase complex protein AlgI